jgi:hypothetical protein
MPKRWARNPAATRNCHPETCFSAKDLARCVEFNLLFAALCENPRRIGAISTQVLIIPRDPSAKGWPQDDNACMISNKSIPTKPASLKKLSGL